MDLYSLRFVPPVCTGSLVVATLPLSKSLVAREAVLRYFLGDRSWLQALSGAEQPDDVSCLVSALLRLLEAPAEVSVTVDARQSGTAWRFLLAVAATRPGCTLIRASRQLRRRPLERLCEVLRGMGASVERRVVADEQVTEVWGGRLHSVAPIDAGAWESSQFVSALLLIAHCIEGGVSLCYPHDAPSARYVELTCTVLKRYGVAPRWERDALLVGQGSLTHPGAVALARDWSAAAIWFLYLGLLGEVGCSLLLEGLAEHEAPHPDQRIVALARPWGVQARATEAGLLLTRVEAESDSLPGEIDLSACLDLFPIVSAYHALRQCEVLLTGLEHLVYKESNRLEAMVYELHKLGCGVEADAAHGLFRVVRPSLPFVPPAEGLLLHAYGDHRIAMALAVSGVACCRRSLAPLYLSDPHSVDKSYPGFWRDADTVGIISSEAVR